MKTISEYLIDVVDTIVKNRINELKNTTSLCEKRSAQIKEVLGNGLYIISIDGVQCTVKSKNTYSVNDVVTVLTRFGKLQEIYILP